MARLLSYLKCISALLLLLCASSANAQLLLTTSPTLTGTTTPLILTISRFNQFPITLTANTPIKFDTPQITGLLQFRLKLCENGVGGFTPVFSAVQSGVSIVNNVTNAIQKTTANYCEVQNWTFNEPANQIVLESVSPPNASGSGAVPINNAPAQTGNYNFQGFAGNNLACPQGAGDILVRGCNVDALVGTFSGQVTATAVQATNEITLANNTVSIGSTGNAVNLNNSTTVTQGTFTAGAFGTTAANAPSWMGSTENCTSTYHAVTVTANSTLTLACPVNSTFYQITYDFYQPAMGSTFTYSFVAANGATLYYPGGGGLPAPCATNGCYDRILINWSPTRNNYSVQFLQTFDPLNVNTPATCPVGQVCKFFAAAGSDSNACTQALPCLTVAKAMTFLPTLNPGDQLLFNGGDTWTGQMLTIGDVAAHFVNGSATKPIIIGSYGMGQPIFDENNVNAHCFIAALAGDNSIVAANSVSYVTVQNFTCKHSRLAGIRFLAHLGSIPGITIQNNNVVDWGFGCATSNGACIGSDDGTYNNGIDFQDDGYSASSTANANPDGVHIIGNTVKWGGSHNCFQVHYDTGAVLVSGNTAGPGCVHGYFDVKGIGSTGSQAVLNNNIAQGGVASVLTNNAPLYYWENQFNPNSNIVWQSNVGWDEQQIVLLCPGGIPAGKTAGATLKLYNNTFYASASATQALQLAYFGNGACDGTNIGTANGITLDYRNDIFDGGALSSLTLGGTICTNCGGGTSPYTTCSEDYNDIGGAQGAQDYFTCTQHNVASTHDFVSINPNYVSASGGNFQLTANSPVDCPAGGTANGACAGQSGLTTGNNDMGAY